MTNYAATEHGGPLLQALLILCQHHQRDIHPDTLISGLPLDHGILTPSVFARAAQRAKLSSKIVNKPLHDLNAALFPAILLLNNDQACVLVSLNHEEQTAEVIYPELPNATVTVSVEQLAADYRGHALYARPEYYPTEDSNRFGIDTRRHWFWGVIQQNRRLYHDVILAAIVINVFAIATPMFVMNVYDRVVPNSAFSTLWVLALGMLILLTADLGLKLLRSWFVDLAASRTDIKLSSRIMDQVLSMQMQHRPAASGSFAANLQAFESVRSFVSSLTIVALADLPFVLLFVVVIGLISWPLAIPILVGGTLIFIYALITQHNMRQLAQQGLEAGAERNAILIESVSHLETVKSFNTQSAVQSRWEKIAIVLTSNAAKMRLLSASVSNGSAYVQSLTGIAIIIVGVYLLSEGHLTQGGLIAAYLLSSRAMAPISQAAGLLAQFHQASTSMQALNAIMELPREQQGSDTKINRPVLRGDIEFRRVSFSYPDSDQLALNQVSFTLKAGEHVAILGKNGSGKSTLEKLILGLYQPKEGSILIDGVDIKQLDVTQLRRNIGYVPQEVALFKGSLKHNIVLGHDEVDDEQLLQTLTITGLLPMVHHHPAGIALEVGERGQCLSGGQRQAVGIARALVQDPPILILDEPTASLDHASEELIKKTLADEGTGKTMLIITHRSSLLNLAKRLIVIDQGRIVADGPKETVMEALRQGRIAGAAS